MGKDGVDAADAVHYLRNMHIHDDACQGVRLRSLDPVLLNDKVEHGVDSDSRGHVEVFVEGESYPAGGRVGSRGGKVHVVAQAESEFYHVHWTLDGRAANLAVALGCMTV